MEEQSIFDHYDYSFYQVMIIKAIESRKYVIMLSTIIISSPNLDDPISLNREELIDVFVMIIVGKVQFKPKYHSRWKFSNVM